MFIYAVINLHYIFAQFNYIVCTLHDCENGSLELNLRILEDYIPLQALIIVFVGRELLIPESWRIPTDFAYCPLKF